ncbi:endonuclease/exonuclease/phosphatase family protein [Bacillus solimangrovi]|uniref:Endonuclease/exonuclease/phosphatase domain-containing protein n=1 Tax=Bacillus solimangrovi TaxID=1305675 RepID=A0A1E5LI46_9BACI|nr:endonuclease/exonuclease/phosphatase family protein [Bacillus solimangrovi]OEH93747.1 hypothetical protein BFG57_11215 [Bacillus solimangrovi]
MKQRLSLFFILLFVPLFNFSEAKVLEQDESNHSLSAAKLQKQKVDAETNIKIISFNVLANRSTWSERSNGIIDKIRDLNPDIAGLQETMSTQRRDISNALTDEYQLVEFDIPVTYGNPILLKKDRFDILGSGFVDAAECGNTRYITWLLLRDKSSNKEFHFYNNHFCVRSSSNSSQAEHVIELAELIEQHQTTSSSGTTAIVVGDFNATRNRTIMRYLLDEGTITGQLSPVQLVDTWEVVYPNMSKPSTTERDAAIDWILTIPEETIIDASVDDSEGFSDHHPVTATFQF